MARSWSGHSITSQIQQAIETMSIYIAIFSLTYEKSRWCLEPCELRWTGKDRTEAYAKALSKHEGQLRINLQAIQKWTGALDYVAG